MLTSTNIIVNVCFIGLWNREQTWYPPEGFEGVWEEGQEGIAGEDRVMSGGAVEAGPGEGDGERSEPSPSTGKKK